MSIARMEQEIHYRRTSIRSMPVGGWFLNGPGSQAGGQGLAISASSRNADIEAMHTGEQFLHDRLDHFLLVNPSPSQMSNPGIS
jgi:hypothetical protein